MKNITSRVLTRKNAPRTGDHICRRTISIFELSRVIIITNENIPATFGNLFNRPEPFFKLIQDILKLNVLTKSHEAWTINLLLDHLKKNTPPPRGLVFQQTRTIF
ncbi:hypothetical protein DPMN_176424 [Dreissena polymorpha]|uniref:Uncharacterized protein n=1 Tax=Dreissena polymorpha TaxID=45954 RepID=A0A9D4E8D0_DREPO|nr:hypothetical protein DPMN_176241 [Dreissena polymorpha]KAH3775028.1 hypothetical protein DPMN_176424 [Dreissena polymorpha]